MNSNHHITLICALLFYYFPAIANTAEKEVLISCSFIAIDAYTAERTANIRVGIYTHDGELIFEGKTNEHGRLAPELNLKEAKHEVRVSDEKNQYKNYSYTFWVSKKWKFHEMQLDLYPASSTLDALIAQEDSIYGTPESGDLSSDLNTEVLIYGCESVHLTDATFPGGVGAMQEFIANNVIFPQASIQMNEQGRVYAEFIVETDGTISHVSIKRGAAALLDAETIRIIRVMPKWIPAQCDGRAVRSIALLPMSFNLE